MPTTTMQIRTRRRRGRKISRRRPRRQSRMSRRQSLSRRRLKPRSGGKDPHLQGAVESFPLLAPVEHTKTTEEIDHHTIELARELLANPKIKNYLNNVANTMITKLGGPDKLYEAILAAAAAAKQQAGGAPHDKEGEGEEEEEDLHPHHPTLPIAGPSPFDVFITNIIAIIGRTRISIPSGVNMIILVCLIFTMFFMEVVEARGGRGRGRARVSITAIGSMFETRYQDDQVQYFCTRLLSLLGLSPAWIPGPYSEWTGPKFGP